MADAVIAFSSNEAEMKFSRDSIYPADSGQLRLARRTYLQYTYTAHHASLRSSRSIALSPADYYVYGLMPGRDITASSLRFIFYMPTNFRTHC